MYLLDFSRACFPTLGHFEFLDLEKLPGAKASSTYDFLKNYCSSAKYCIKPKYSNNNTLPIKEPYPDFIDCSEEDTQFCFRETNGDVTVLPFYKVIYVF